LSDRANTAAAAYDIPISYVDIACGLLLLKTRHRLSGKCMGDLLKFMSTLGINVPSSWHLLKKELSQRSPCHLAPRLFTVCSHCERASIDRNACSHCKTAFSPGTKPSTFYIFSVKDQIANILRNWKNFCLPDRSSNSSPSSMHDIVDGKAYRDLLNIESEPFITLSMNVDGIQPNKGTNKSIWPSLMVCNELPLKERYKIDNLIVSGIWSGPKKPNRETMSLFYEQTVEELVHLEEESYFEVQMHGCTVKVKLKVFLIASCCDKPAQALIQRIPEPIAAFGCGRCEVQGIGFLIFFTMNRRLQLGKVVPSENDGHVNTFAMTADEDSLVSFICYVINFSSSQQTNLLAAL
jgi:hypothetical protein